MESNGEDGLIWKIVMFFGTDVIYEDDAHIRNITYLIIIALFFNLQDIKTVPSTFFECYRVKNIVMT